MSLNVQMNASTPNIKYQQNKMLKNNINFCGKSDVFIKETTKKSSNIITRIKSFFNKFSESYKQNVRMAERAGLSMEEYERNLGKLGPNRVDAFVDYIPVCLSSCTNEKEIERELIEMLNRIKKSKEVGVSVFLKEDENQIITMINDIRKGMSKGTRPLEEDLENLEDLWHSKVLYPNV